MQKQSIKKHTHIHTHTPNNFITKAKLLGTIRETLKKRESKNQPDCTASPDDLHSGGSDYQTLLFRSSPGGLGFPFY